MAYRDVVTRRAGFLFLAAGLASALAATTPLATASAASYPSDSHKPDLVARLTGYQDLWDSTGNLHGTVKDAAVLQHDDMLAVWINQHATKAEQFKALQDSEHQNSAGTAYDQSHTIATGFGQTLEKVYLKGLRTGALPKTAKLVNSTNGTAGAYVSVTAAKDAYSHPRPYLPTDKSATAVKGDDSGCAPSKANAASLASTRVGQPYADAKGNLDITRVPDATDKTHEFSTHDVKLTAGYGTTGLCLGGSFPSGHTTSAYESALTLATMVPKLAPGLLARASENGNDRIVLGVHYPLDVIGGRISGQVAVAFRWSDPTFVKKVLLPARSELIAYFHKETGQTIAWEVDHQHPYTSDPYGGAAMPGGSSQEVIGPKSAVRVYTERLTYGPSR